MSETLRGGLIISLCAHACVHVKGHRTMAEGHTMATASNLIRSASSVLKRRGNFMCDAFARCPGRSEGLKPEGLSLNSRCTFRGLCDFGLDT